jgi:hypothetical protein
MHAKTEVQQRDTEHAAQQVDRNSLNRTKRDIATASKSSETSHIE